MFNVSPNNTNIPSGSASGNFNMSGSGIHNEFATPEVDDGKSTKRDTVKLFLISALILTILLALASYFYTIYLNSQVEAKKLTLSDLDNNTNVVTFEKNLPDMRNLSEKIKLLNSVNDSRGYISGMLLPILGSVVESSRTSYVYFNRIYIKRNGSDPTMNVSVSGLAQDYFALSRQISDFKSGPLSKYFSKFQFSGFTLNPNGQITFNFSFNMDVSTNNYLNFLKSANSGILSQQNTISGILFKADTSANIFSATSTTDSTSTYTATTSINSIGN